ncbi:MAG: saccharopine dehydrogenase family protein [Kiritimatiellia bacterium]
MSTVLIIGIGGVGTVTARKCGQAPEVFSKIVLASRTVSKCGAVKNKITGADVAVEQVDANDADQVAGLIEKHSADIVINTALPYHDLSIMEACLKAGAHYVDTANYESPGKTGFSYREQWAYHDRFRDCGLMALLGSGFDPGVTNIFIAHMKKHDFDKISRVDIVDCNAGNHGHPFATNFNTEINVREVTGEACWYEGGEWKRADAMSVSEMFDFPEAGGRRMYLMYHEELESLVKHFPELEGVRFWMTFSDEYINHLRVLQNVGMTSIEPVNYRGCEIVPLQFLDFMLPTPASLGKSTWGKTCIGCVVEGEKAGKGEKKFVYNVCDHEEVYRELGCQAVSYTAGVPPMIGAKLIAEGRWTGRGVFNVEQLDPDPFMEELARYGLPWTKAEFTG